VTDNYKEENVTDQSFGTK